MGFVYTRRRICQISVTCRNTSQDLWLLSAHRTFLRWIKTGISVLSVSSLRFNYGSFPMFSFLYSHVSLLCYCCIFTVAEMIHIYVSGIFS